MKTLHSGDWIKVGRAVAEWGPKVLAWIKTRKRKKKTICNDEFWDNVKREGRRVPTI